MFRLRSVLRTYRRRRGIIIILSLYSETSISRRVIWRHLKCVFFFVSGDFGIRKRSSTPGTITLPVGDILGSIDFRSCASAHYMWVQHIMYT